MRWMGVSLVLAVLPMWVPGTAGAAPSFNYPDFASTDGLTLAGGVMQTPAGATAGPDRKRCAPHVAHHR